MKTTTIAGFACSQSFVPRLHPPSLHSSFFGVPSSYPPCNHLFFQMPWQPRSLLPRMFPRAVLVAAFSTSQPQQPPSPSHKTLVVNAIQGNSSSVSDALNDLQHLPSKPPVCTADELHYVSIPGTNWKLALWRYLPPAQAPIRNHPLLLLSGVGTNAIGFDLDPTVSFARKMAFHGFDTWILEVRGAGLSKMEDQSLSSQIVQFNKGVKNVNEGSFIQDSEIHAGEIDSVQDDSKVASRLYNILNQIVVKSKRVVNEGQSRFTSSRLLDRITSFLEHIQLAERYTAFQGKILQLLDGRKNSVVVKQVMDLSNKLLRLLEDGQKVLSPQLSDLQDRFINVQQISDLQDRLISTIDEFQKLLDLMVLYDWDFDNFLEDDLPVVMKYICDCSKPKDGKIHAAGHSMGGILIYALIASQKEKCGLASAVTLASSLDYTVSNSSLKLLLPLADPAQLLNVPAVPLGALMAAIHSLAASPPYTMAWLNPQVSAQDMMDAELFKRLVLNNFCTIPAKLLLQLTTVFRPGGLSNRTGTVFYKDQLRKSTTPVLAIAGDEDLVCPPEAVLDTVKALPEDLVEYKLFGGDNNIHYGHYDLVCGRWAKEQVHPYVVDFLTRHDTIRISS